MMKSKHWLYGILISELVVIFFIIVVYIQQSKQETVTCNPPYIKVGTECCLDQNSNGVCDKDEAQTTQQTSAQIKNASEFSLPKSLSFVKSVTLNNDLVTGDFYHLLATCSDNDVYLTFYDTGDSNVYVAKYSPDLNRKTSFISLTKDINTKNEREDFPDHSFIYYNGFFYGVFHSYWPDDNFGLYLVKYNLDFEIVKQVAVGYYGDNYEKSESSDSPLIQVYGDSIYVINKHIHYEDSPYISDNNHQDGNVVSIYDFDLTLKDKISLKTEGITGISTGDLVLCENDYCVIESDHEDSERGDIVPKFSLLRYDKSGRLIQRRQLIPSEILDTFQDADTRTIFSDGFYYIPIVSLTGKSKKSRFFGNSLYIGIFNKDFGLQSLLKVPDNKDDYGYAKVEYSQDVCKINDNVYDIVGLGRSDEEGLKKIVLRKFKLK